MRDISSLRKDINHLCLISFNKCYLKTIQLQLYILHISMEEFVFSENDFVFTVDWKHWKKTVFNLKLEKLWDMKREKGYFKYDLNIIRSRQLEGEHGFFAQLNTDRALNKRSPDEITSVKQPFSYNGFNFTKVNKEEMVFSISKRDCVLESELDRNYFLINISPLERYHCLLAPSLFKCLRQILTKEGLYLGISSLLLNGSPELRAGFNSLCGYASVNHLHLHTYYLSNQMKLETIPVELFIGRCYVLENYPAKAFVFQITSKEEIEDVVNDIHKIILHFTKENVAHNVYITRGLSFEKANCNMETSERDCVRIYIWARTSSYGAKALDEFNPALCELFGHLVVKTNEAYDELTEERVSSLLHSITHQPYNNMKESVKKLFK